MVTRLLLIVVPAYNEHQSLESTIANLNILDIPFEIVIIDDGSDDRTLEIAKRLATTQVRPTHVVGLSMNCGIGSAVQTGYRFALESRRYHYVLQFDADGQHDVLSIPAVLKACDDQDADLVIGSRFLRRSPAQFRGTVLRRVGIWWLSMLISYLMGQRITDPTSGMRCAGPRAWKLFAKNYPDDYPEPESLMYLWRQGLKVIEVSAQMHARQHGVSSIGIWAGAYYLLKVSLAIILARWRRPNIG